MKRWPWRWFTDTLSKRLFLLMWVALVASHVVAFFVGQAIHRQIAAPQRMQATSHNGPRLPTFPSLPPTPGLPGPGSPGPGAGPRPPAPTFEQQPGPPPSAIAPVGIGPDDAPPPQRLPLRGPPRQSGMPTLALVLDYGLRLIVIALAAWFGSRWLARPMRDLVGASQALGRSLTGLPVADADVPRLDERRGTWEVRRAAQVFNAMSRQLHEQFQGRGLMMAAISHDLRTPLTRLRMRLESMTADAELQQRSIADIREMNALIDTVLDVFRNETPGGGEPMQRTDVGALVQSLVDDRVEQGQAVTCSGEAAVTQVQPNALRRVIDNLINNALRYGERADVTVSQDGQHLRIVVDDAGPGISPEHLESVFQPFYRAEASRNRHTGGTGLGLFIARGLVQRQGGTLSLSNRAEGGLRAEVTLPVNWMPPREAGRAT